METQNDHDLLITIKEKITNVVEELRLLRDGTNERLKNVEIGKLDKSEFTDFKVSLKEAGIEKQNDIDKQIKIVQDCVDENSKDIKILNRNMYIAIGMAILLQIAIPIIVKVLFKI